MRTPYIAASLIILIAGLTVLLYARHAAAHCDTMDGPVVTAARKALDSGDIGYVLPWVAEDDEPAIRAAFDHTRKVRALGAEAKDLADNYFFETLVRVHRAGEGAPYTGLKPAGSEVNPAVAAADKAFETGSDDALVALLTEAVQHNVHSRFAEAKAAQSKDINDIAARRRGVHAYVEFVHYVEAVYNSAAGSAGEAPAAHGHAPAHD